MRIRSCFVMKLGGLLVAQVTRCWMGLLDYQVAAYDPTADVVHPDFRGPMMYLFWHEYIPFPLYLRGHCNLAMLISQHQDAEWLSQAARLMGYATVRGSTNRGGATALRELVRKSRTMNLAITPDGPVGPRRKLAPGPIYLASRLSIPIVALGFGYDRPWRNPWSWDRFAVPRPFSRARAILGPPVYIPRHLTSQQFEEARLGIERLLNHLTIEAEKWAASGARIDVQQPLLRQSAVVRRAA